VRALIADAWALLATLPPGIQAAITAGVQQAASQLQANLTAFVQLALALLAASVLAALGTFGFILGFIAVPTWLIAVLTHRQTGARILRRTLPTWLQPDFWAVVRIADRTFGTFLRGQIVRAVAFGCALYVALVLLNRYDLANTRFPLSLAVFATVAYLIPDIGPAIGAFPVALIALVRSPRDALIVLAAYIGVTFLEQQWLAPRIRRRSIDLHPAVLLPLLIALSQFGFFWLVVGTPLIIVARDLFRYVDGRFGSPTRPAGVLPGERVAAPVKSIAAQGPRPLPSAIADGERAG
jgi:predicted PurR-regulated permease PerM